MSGRIAERYETVLVTGGAGFVGSNLSIFLKERFPSLKVIALDNLRRRGSELNLERVKRNGVSFVYGDIRNREDLSLDFKVDLLIECSAEPSVLAGYAMDPMYVINTNLYGAVNCFELARAHGADVLFFSTSRVYPYDSLNALRYHETETRFVWDETALEGVEGVSPDGVSENFRTSGAKSLYGATKICAEELLTEYIDRYGLKGVVDRCGVIGGPWQFGRVDQGVVALWVAAHVFGSELAYIGFGGEGKQVRDVVHIDDICELVLLQLDSIDACSGQVYNIGGGNERSFSLRELTALCREHTGNRISISSVSENRPGDVRIYVTDYKKASEHFGWEPRRGMEEIIWSVVEWIRREEGILRETLL